MKAKKYLLCLAAALPFTGFAQGLLNNGAHIVITNGSNIYIDGASGNFTAQTNVTPGVIDNASAGGTIYVGGNWVNNCFGNYVFTGNGSTVILNGANQSIGGLYQTKFFNLTLQGSGTKTLSSFDTQTGGVTAPFTGVLSLGTRPLDLNSNFLYVRNPLPSAITYGTGYIISETNAVSNPSVVHWYMGMNTGTYVIPFGVAGTQIPLTFDITSGMNNPGDLISVSTRATATSNNTPWSTGVTHMFDPTLAQDGSDEAVIDRWWDIYTSGSLTANITFSYRGSENTLQVPYNTGNIGMQYWDAGWIPDNSTYGSAPAVLAGVGSVTVPGFVVPFLSGLTPFVLSSVTAPLPIELISFKPYCENDKEQLIWSTASETNNHYFTVERSDDGLAFNAIGTVSGNGTTTQMHQYTFTDPQAVQASTYYRLRQTDYNGQQSLAPVVTAEYCGTANDYMDAFSYETGVTILLNVSSATTYSATLFDAQGKLITGQNFSAETGANRFSLNDKLPATGIYFLNMVGNDGKTFSKKLYVTLQ